MPKRTMKSVQAEMEANTNMVNSVMSGTSNLAQAQLRAFAERIEKLEEEKAELSRDVREVYGEAKSQGYDTKALKKVIKLRAQEEHERLEEEAMLDTYCKALGISRQLDMFDARPEPASPIAVLGRTFDSLLGLASETGNEIEFNGRRLKLVKDEGGALVISELPAPAERKAA